MFPENELFQYVLLGLDDQMGEPIPPVRPMGCDRYVARSALQKSIRRGRPDIALSALARMLTDHPASVWRHLVTIAVEDIGTADIDLVAGVVAAARSPNWRTSIGGEWAAAAPLVKQMAEANHCQSACDLMLVGMYRLDLEAHRTDALEASPSDLAIKLADTGLPIVERGIAGLALAGSLPAGQPHRDPHAVFEIIAEAGHFSHIVATSRAAWRLTRDPMTLMLPIIWQARSRPDRVQTVDDELPPTMMLGDMPDYALDQHTRGGRAVAQELVRRDADLRRLLADAGLSSADWPRAVGNVMFLIDGSPVVRREIWPIGEMLRQPFRVLPLSTQMDTNLAATVAYLRRQAPIIAYLRRGHIITG